MNLIYKTSNIYSNLKKSYRSQIYVGFQCHQKCGFCYYKHNCNDKMFDFEKIKRQIDFEYEYGIRDFEITGGEPSEYQYLRKVCQYIKSKDKNSKIAVITNGGLWKSDIWDIIDEVLVSYHLGKNDKNYDKTIFPLGCTYEKVKKTIDLAHSLGKIVRTNTVIASFNYNQVDYIIDDLAEFKPFIVNFLPINLFDQAQLTGMSKYINYNELRPIIKHAIDRIKIEITSNIFIRYFPFCDMEGYQQHIVGQLQHIYDWFDWNRELDGIDVIKMSENSGFSLKELGRYGSKSIEKALQTRKSFYEKNFSCLTCKYYAICDGVEKTKNGILKKYIKQTKGKLIKDISEFQIDTFKLYQQKYNI